MAAVLVSGQATTGAVVIGTPTTPTNTSPPVIS